MTSQSTPGPGQAPAAPSGAPGQARELLTPEGFAACYRDAYQVVWCIAAAVLSDRAQAHDVVQEAAVVALGKLSDFQPGTNFTAWFGQIVRYAALNERRSKQRRPSLGLESGVMESAAPTHDAPAPNGPALSAPLASAIQTLDETARACLVLRTVMGMTYAQISASLGIPEGTAMSHVHRSRQALRARLTAVDNGGLDGRP
ncbi:MAG: sigma-70 family RNA polymerase sigma factor [Phycisphaerales bacterium]|nr:sigma-70 family RNA polymerase sigma factor [Phycisphaerales bacterium]